MTWPPDTSGGRIVRCSRDDCARGVVGQPVVGTVRGVPATIVATPGTSDPPTPSVAPVGTKNPPFPTSVLARHGHGRPRGLHRDRVVARGAVRRERRAADARRRPTRTGRSPDRRSRPSPCSCRPRSHRRGDVEGGDVARVAPSSSPMAVTSSSARSRQFEITAVAALRPGRARAVTSLQAAARADRLARPVVGVRHGQVANLGRPPTRQRRRALADDRRRRPARTPARRRWPGIDSVAAADVVDAGLDPDEPGYRGGRLAGELRSRPPRAARRCRPRVDALGLTTTVRSAAAHARRPVAPVGAVGPVASARRSRSRLRAWARVALCRGFRGFLAWRCTRAGQRRLPPDARRGQRAERRRAFPVSGPPSQPADPSPVRWAAALWSVSTDRRRQARRARAGPSRSSRSARGPSLRIRV